MPESALTEVAVLAGAAAAFGVVLHMLRQPALVGYILAGVLLGPSALGLLESRESIGLLAELGVLLLLFGIGLELSLRGFKRVWAVAVATALLQIGAALLVVWVAGALLGWSPGLIVIVGFSLALSSTAVAVKILDDIGELRTEIGQVAIGVLIAQDLSVVPMLLVGTGLAAEDPSLWWTVAKLGGAVAVLAGVIVLLSGRRKFHIPMSASLEANEELVAIVALAVCFAAAALSGLLGLSPAYGAFLVGLVIGNTADRPKMVAAMRPIQSALLMLFFLSIGLLLDIAYIVDNLLLVLALVLAVTVGKTVFNVAVLRMLGQPWQRAFLAGTVMGQVGEFSFVLAAAAIGAGLMGPDEYRLLVAVIAVSLVASPLWLLTARRLDAMRWRAGEGARLVLDRLYGGEVRIAAAAAVRLGRGVRRIAGAVRGAQQRMWSRRHAAAQAAAAAAPDKPGAPADTADAEAEPPAGKAAE